MSVIELYIASIGDPFSAETIPSASLPLKASHLNQLAYYAEEIALSQPRLGMYIMHTAYVVAQTCDERLRAEAGYYFARAANHFSIPKVAQEALSDSLNYFTHNKDSYWRARCIWQRNALPWIDPNYPKAVLELKEAIAELTTHDSLIEANLCRLSLMYAYMADEKFELAIETVAHSESYFERENLEQQLAISRIFSSLLAMKRGEHHEALSQAEQAYRGFSTNDALVGMARAYERVGALHIEAEYFAEAIRVLQPTVPLYEQTHLDTRAAACHRLLAQAFRKLGRVREAKESLEASKSIFEQAQWTQAVADVRLDMATLEHQLGNYHVALLLIGESIKTYQQLGVSVKRSEWVQANTYRDLGQYQKALHLYEKTEPQFADEPVVRAQVLVCTAQAWHQLKKPDEVADCLEKVGRNLPNVEKMPQMSAEISLLSAKQLLTEGQTDSAEKQIAHALEITRVHELKDLEIDALLLSGEAKAQYAPQQAQPLIEEAIAYYEAQNAAIRKIMSYRRLAKVQDALGQHTAAIDTLYKAYFLSSQTSPASHWQLCADVAAMTQRQGNIPKALQYYTEMATALVEVRRGFTQPTLVEDYLVSPLEALTQAITLAIENGQHASAIQFIEAGKAQILLQQFSQSSDSRGEGQANINILAELRLDIQAMQAQIEKKYRVDSEHIENLQKMRAHYNQLVEKFTRKQVPVAVAQHIFDIDRFREAANANLDKWIALSYYSVDSVIFCAVITATEHSVETLQISSGLRFSMRLGADFEHQPYIDARDLQRLGDGLIPQKVWEMMDSDTHLLIAPHAALHAMMWPALKTQHNDLALVEQAIPTVTPSLHSLQFLWARKMQNTRQHKGGLVIAVSEFEDEEDNLEHVKHEADWLERKTGAHVLREDEASWPMLEHLTKENILREKLFWHIATHGHFDEYTGQRSGFTLADNNDVWLDQIPQLAPLPPLVFLSACSGGQRYMLAGDEQVGLSSALLYAEAQSVIGSLWPVPDDGSAEITQMFYRHFLDYQKPAVALAWAQRHLLSQGAPLMNWASFTCLGLPQ